MAIVVETTSRSGALVSTEVFDGDRVVVGRGYDCDVILHDPHVDAKHVLITQDSATGSLFCEDLQSLNGVHKLQTNRLGAVHGRAKQVHGGQPFYSGQALQIGKTVIRIYDSRHHTQPALPLSPWEETAHMLAHWWLWGAFAVFILCFQVWDSYLSAPQSQQLSQNILRACYPILGGFIYAGIFAFAGKLYKHDAKLSSHFTIAMMCLVGLSIVEYLAPYFAYWLGIVSLRGTATELFEVGIMFVTIYISLALATPLKKVARSVAAGVIPLAFVLTMLINLLAQPEFKSYPNYDRNLVQPSLQLRGAESLDAYLERIPKAYKPPQEE